MKKFIYTAFLSLLLLSCNDFLDIEPQQETSIKEQFSTLQGTLLALNGAYYKTEDVLSGTKFIYADLQGGNLAFTPTQFGSNQGIINIDATVDLIYNFNDNALFSDFEAVYKSSYAVLNNINNILFYVNQLLDATTEQKNQIKAETLALRAFLHFNLIQIYGQTYNYSSGAAHSGIVYADQVFVGGKDFPARLSVATCYNLMTQDLENALVLFTTKQALSGPNYSFFNSVSTKALFAKIALEKTDYSLATTMANDVINSSGLSLMTAQNYVSEWEKPNVPVSETILEFSAPKSPDGSVVSSTVAAYYKIIFGPNNSILNYGNYATSGDLLALFGATDIRKNCFLQAQLKVATPTGLVLKNYFFTKKHQDNAGTISMRLSEMYLILAEAQARNNNASAALTALNTIRQRANLNALTTTQNLLEEIFLERRRELCFEGTLLFDTARFNKNITRNLDCISLLCNLNYPNPKFVLPIPRATIDVNTNIIQNESY